MANEKIKCGKCGKEQYVDQYKTTSCTKCGAPIKGTKAKQSLKVAFTLTANSTAIFRALCPSSSLVAIQNLMLGMLALGDARRWASLRGNISCH